MELLRNIIENPLLRQMHGYQRSELRVAFARLESCPHKHYLSLYKYLVSKPQKFYSRIHYSKYLTWLESVDSCQRELLQGYLAEAQAEISQAFLHILEINKCQWHDQIEIKEAYELILFIDQNIHPTYLRLIEAVFRPMLRIPAYFSRISRGKGTESLDIYNIIEELKRTPLDEIATPYHHTMRNGIAHGGITFFDSNICYKDKQGNEATFSDREVIAMCDDLIDACNAMVLALSVFIISNQHFGYEMPNQLLIDELKEETKAPWWEIIGCTPSISSGLNQLLIHVSAETRDFGKVQLSVFQSGYLAELFAPGYDRYFFSIRGDKSWPGFASLDGIKLRDLRASEVVRFEDYNGVIETLFFVPRLKLSPFLCKLDNWLIYIGLHWPHFLADFRQKIGLPTLLVREARIHRNSWGCVLLGSVCISSTSHDIGTDVRKSCGKIIRKSLSYARKHTPWSDFTRYLPLGYARISVFCKDHRLRQLYGLGEDLVCTVQIQRIRRIQAPDIFGATIEKLGRYRIAWNRAWLESAQSQPAAADGQAAAP